MTLDPPRLISPSQDPGLNHTCKVLLQWEVTWSQVPGIRTWTSLGGTVCLPTGSLGLTSSHNPTQEGTKAKFIYFKTLPGLFSGGLRLSLSKAANVFYKEPESKYCRFYESYMVSAAYSFIYIYIFFYNLKKCKNHSYLMGNSFSAPNLELFTCPPISSHGAVCLCLA